MNGLLLPHAPGVVETSIMRSGRHASGTGMTSFDSHYHGSMLRGILLLMIIACGAALSRVDEECEACGLIVWRMQTIVSAKQLQLEGVKSAKEKRAKKSSKAHSRRWIRQEYAVELAGAIEEQMATCVPGPCAIAASICDFCPSQSTASG